jgi:SH3 domain protein
MDSMIRKFFIALLATLAGGVTMAQDVVWVTDSLQLGLHRARDTSDTAFQNLVSGTRLDVLERAGAYARVRTPDGQEGWVRTAFLVDDPPARFRVAEAEAELEALRIELARARAARISAEEETARLRRQVAGHNESLGSVQTTLSRLRAENTSSTKSDLQRYRRSVPLHLTIAGLLVAGVGGFAAGPVVAGCPHTSPAWRFPHLLMDPLDRMRPGASAW